MTARFKNILRNIYLYTFSAVGIVIFIVGAITLLNVFLKTYVLHLEHYNEYYYSYCSEPVWAGETYQEKTVEEIADCEEEEEVNDSDSRKRDLAKGLAEIIVGTPVWLYHWVVIQRNRKEEF